MEAEGGADGHVGGEGGGVEHQLGVGCDLHFGAFDFEGVLHFHQAVPKMSYMRCQHNKQELD